MSWLKIDDAIGEHRKTRRLLRAGGTAAFGLHALALVHCSRYLTDGHVETEFVEETLDAARVKGKQRAQIVDALVTHGQWTVAADGWQIHGYLDHNPSRHDVEQQREKDRQRKAKGRQTQAERREDDQRTGPGVHADPGPEAPQDPSDVRDVSARTDDGIRGESDRPVPSRPVPSQEPPHPLTGEQPAPASAKQPRPKWKGKPVNDLTARRLHRTMLEFDRQTGTRYAGRIVTATGSWSTNASRVLGALAAHPELHDETRCAAVIRHALADPRPFWGEEKPEPRHVFAPNVIEGHVAATEGRAATAAADVVADVNNRAQERMA